MRHGRAKVTLIALGVAAVVLVAAGGWMGWSWHKQQEWNHLLKQWELVKEGMTVEEVKALVGEPGYVGWCLGSGGSWWYYGRTRHFRLSSRPTFPYVGVDSWHNWDGAVLFDEKLRVFIDTGRLPYSSHVIRKSELGHETYETGP